MKNENMITSILSKWLIFLGYSITSSEHNLNNCINDGHSNTFLNYFNTSPLILSFSLCFFYTLVWYWSSNIDATILKILWSLS